MRAFFVQKPKYEFLHLQR